MCSGAGIDTRHPDRRLPGTRTAATVAWRPLYHLPGYYYEGQARGHHKHRKHPHRNERWDDCDD